ncbi:hypothetical protein BV911_13130 [Pseudoruegeria sp. SK021]|nr:hypothetical protein BV911_13130 [Pseudoruegeria sp. SK021]
MKVSTAKLTILGMAMMTALALPVMAETKDRNGPQFGAFDTNADGQISVEEMTAHQQGRFNEVDTNGDGKLSAQEMAAHRQNAEMQHMERRAARMIEEMDADGDAMLTMEEFSAKGKMTMFERIDVNKDGVIDAEEFSKMQHKGPRGGHKDGKQRGQHEQHQKDGMPDEKIDG